MQSKLQELTDRLYQEGLSKGKTEGDQYLQKAREEAGKIVADARKEAEQLIQKAASDARDLKEKAKSDIKMASEQSLQATRKDIENLLVGKLCDEGTKAVLGDTAMLKEIILTVAQKFSATESADLNLILPEKLREQLEPWVAGELKAALKGEVKAEFSKKIAGGFNIGPKDGSYFISMSEETFRSLIGEYLRPVTRKILFGE